MVNEQIIALAGAAVLLAVVAAKLLWLRRKSSAPAAARESAGPGIAQRTAVPGDGDAETGDALQALAGIPGIGERHAAALVAAGVDSVTALRACGQDDAQLHALADRLGLEDFVLARWIGSADLLQVPGMSPALADALVRTGVRSREALAGANPDRVQNKLAAAAAGSDPPGPNPDRATVVALIASAAQGAAPA